MLHCYLSDSLEESSGVVTIGGPGTLFAGALSISGVWMATPQKQENRASVRSVALEYEVIWML